MRKGGSLCNFDVALALMQLEVPLTRKKNFWLWILSAYPLVQLLAFA